MSAFDSHVEDYDRDLARGLALAGEDKEFFARGRIAFLKRWLDMRGAEPPKRILDYGCGLGHASAMLADAFPSAEVLGVDPANGFVERARERHASARVRFGVLDGFEANDAEPADLIHVNGVVHHVPVDERPALFAQLAARLAPGGHVALFENNPLNPGTQLVMRRIAFDQDAVKVPAWEARDRLRSAELAPICTRYLFYLPRALSALRPIERFLDRVPFGAQYAVLARREPSPQHP